MIYTVIDFLRSRLGQMLVLSIVVIVVIIGVGSYHKAKQEEALAAGAFPRASEHPHYDRGKTMRVEGKEVYGHLEANPAFEPFQPTSEFALEPEPTSALPILNLDPQPMPEQGSFEPLPSLIASERGAAKAEAVATSENKIPSLHIERGTLLHCQLTAPLSSGQGNAPVMAKLTKPYLNRGRVLLPTGTRMMGRLQNGKGDRMYFADKWQVELSSGNWVSLSGQVQEKDLNTVTGRYLSSDGLAGMPGVVGQSPEQKNQGWFKLLGTFGSAATRVAQNRTRTVLGDQIPASARNILLEGTGDLIEGWSSQFLEGHNLQSVSASNSLVIGAGTQFYLELSELH